MLKWRQQEHSMKLNIGMVLANGPWGSRPSGNDEGDRTVRPRGSKNDTPDLDNILRNAQDKFRHSLGGGSPGTDKPEISVGFLIAALAAIWLGTGLYRVQTSENAVLMTFGKWTDTRKEAGLGWHIPWPIQDVQKVNVGLERRIVIGGQDGVPAARSTDANGEVQQGRLMLTGDENIINIDFIVTWRVNDAGKYLFSIRDPDTTIRKVAESAMREIIGRTSIQKALTEGRGDIEARTKELMQKILDDYQTGVVVNSMQLQRVDPPTPVVDAFDDVQRSRADKERMKNEAEAYANDIVPKARGDAQKILQDAEAYKQAVISKAEGDAQRFLSVYDAYKESKDVTEKRMYLETMQEILRNSKKVIIGESGAGVVPYLPLDTGKEGGK
jgi:membrane protease subunit HflK